MRYTCLITTFRLNDALGKSIVAIGQYRYFGIKISLKIFLSRHIYAYSPRAWILFTSRLLDLTFCARSRVRRCIELLPLKQIFRTHTCVFNTTRDRNGGSRTFINPCTCNCSRYCRLSPSSFLAPIRSLLHSSKSIDEKSILRPSRRVLCPPDTLQSFLIAKPRDIIGTTTGSLAK